MCSSKNNFITLNLMFKFLIFFIILLFIQPAFTENIKVFELESELESVEHRNKLLSKNIDLDYLDTLFRSKLKFGTKDEILIRFR